MLGDDGGMPGKRPAPGPLVDALLAAAGIAGPWTLLGVATAGRINTTSVIEAAAGTRAAVRVYGWPFDDPPSFDRRAKEVAWAERLAAADVPVARFLAVADLADGTEGALLEWIDGQLLGTVAARAPGDDLSEAWRGAGEALARAHAVPVGVEGQGWVTADGVVPFPEGGFPTWIVAPLVARARRLHGAPSGGRVDAGRVEALAPALQAALATARTGFAHGDANPWNGMVHQGPDGSWRFRAWLDWEMAWAADPAYDHVRATEQRFADIGPTPDTWWEGYGSRPDPVNHEIYALHLVLWKAEERLDGHRSPETDRTWATLGSVPDPLTRLEHVLA